MANHVKARLVKQGERRRIPMTIEEAIFALGKLPRVFVSPGELQIILGVWTTGEAKRMLRQVRERVELKARFGCMEA